MQRLVRRGRPIGLLAAAALAASGALSPAPVGVNFVVASLNQARGALSLDPALPVTNPDLKLAGPVFGYTRTLDLGGDMGKLDLVLPVGRLTGTARFQGQPVERRVEGVGDPLLRLSVILYGAPAMTPEAFKAYRQDLLVGVGVLVVPPLGRYDADKLLNLGGNRWAVRPNLSMSKAFGRWVVELKSDVSLFTQNDDFFGGHRREESPIYSGQANLIYNWPSGVWSSIDVVYYAGGQTTVDDLPVGARLHNSRAGATVAVPVTRRHSIKLFGSAGVSTRTHNEFGLYGLAWQYRWGAGL
jgi:hypothetical protein